ncbi:class I SAM-dependent methyltransferase [Adhaeribacter rhizoryzae]|uniref:Class I SAM-dependent methyltransferase n=1 Tax=Adhaeribacter rhizoryzae TaxID=2607907 RepID=A0A5M6DDM4_9BACT|nr:class I SAM-dependent methyltransferase [Adhaeribacter rhizoryzae]KAA5545628.1 class I SAM-dependent methyltransferase [Adhaeribacter rhizoryzae]
MLSIPSPGALRNIFGDLDIYIFDQLLKGRITENTPLLDAGCGSGRNLHYLLQAGCPVFGIDHDPESIRQVQALAATLAPHLPATNFLVADVADIPFDDAAFKVVICSAVLHFARSEAHFRRIIQELWRVLQPGGMLLCRLSTIIGLENKLPHLHERFYQMPHGKTWFLADEALLLEQENILSAHRLEPLKTVLVEEQRAMTTWVLQKPG